MYSIYAGDELLYSDVYPNHSRKVTSPTLKMAVDEAGSLDFTVSEVNKCYTTLQRMNTIITVKKYDIPIWDGRIIEEYRDFNKNKKMYVEGALAFLNDTTQPIKEYKNVSFEELVTSILDVHNGLVDPARQIFWGGISDSFNPENLEYWATAYDYTLTDIRKLAEYLGCHYLIKKDPYTGVNSIVFFRGVVKSSNQTIMFGENLLDYTENYDLSKLATVLLPLCKTDRESSDVPRAEGTDIDLSHPQPYDDDKHYGVIMATTQGYLCRKFLTGGAHVTIPQYRNKLNLEAREIDGAYVVVRPDTVGIDDQAEDSATGLWWSVPDYVQIWPYTYAESLVRERGDIDRYDLSEAQGAWIRPTPITNGRVDFYHVSDKKPDIRTPMHNRFSYDNKYMAAYSDNVNKVRTYRDRSRVLFQNIVEQYGIITPKKDGQCAVIEIDYSHFKSLYLTASHFGDFTENYTSVSVWKKSKTFDEGVTFVPRPRDKQASIDEGFIFASGWDYVHEVQPGITGHTYCYYPAFGYSVGYKMDPTADPDACTFADLVEDTVPMIINHDKYEFVREYEDINCFERHIDLKFPFDEETDSPRILIVISGTQGPFAVTLVSEDDEKTDSTITIGMDPNGLDLSKTHYVRYYTDHNTWRAPETPEEWEAADATHYHANDIYDETLGYGVLVPVTSGYRLVTRPEFEDIGTPSFNVFNDGVINTATVDTGIITGDLDHDDHSVCVLVVKASYEDEDGKKYPNSIYISTKLKGKSALYAIYEFTDGNGGNGTWDVDEGPKPSNVRTLRDPIDFGKYINGYTTLDAKKITMPYAKDPDRLMFVVIASSGESPRVWLHDPKQAEKMQYLTIASVNNGDPKIKASSINRFTSTLEYGDIDDQNGSLSNSLTYKRIRTTEPLSINTDGSYLFMFEKTDPTAIISADVYMYGKIDGYLGHTGFQVITDSEPYILLPYLYEGYSLNVVFRKRDPDTMEYLDITTNDIIYPMVWREDKAVKLLFTQGSLTAVTDPITEYVEIESDDTDTHTVSTADYYTNTDGVSTLKVSIELDTAVIPATVIVDGDQYIVKSRTVYVSYWEQSPDIEIDSDGTTRHVVYKSYTDPHTVHSGIVFKIPSRENMRYKFYAYYDIEYEDENGIEHTVDHSEIEFLPEHVKVFSIVSYTDDHKIYVPPNDSFDKYGYIEKRIEFEDVESSSELKERAEQYLYQSQFDEMTLKVKALDMTIYNPGFNNDLDIADAVKVISAPHGLYRDFPITDLSLPFDNLTNSTYELGYDNRDSLAQIIQGG